MSRLTIPRLWTLTLRRISSLRSSSPKLVIASAGLVLAVAGCGGGGGGGTATAIGRVLNVQTGAPPNPSANVSLGGGASVPTNSVDGSFSAIGPSGSTQVTVDTIIFGVKTYTVAPVTGTTAVGDLWFGPQETTLKGRILSATDNSPVPGASVSFAGRIGTTDASGIFQLPKVAYSSSDQSVFWGIVGTIRKAGFVVTNFTASPFTDSGGITNVGDIHITSLTDPNPPGQPYNIYGKVIVSSGVSGTIVTLKQGGSPVRIVNVASDGKYLFWIVPGSYTISYQKGALTAPDQNANLTQPNQVIHIPDVTLH